MAQTSAFCRAQEAYHRDRGASATLQNVRTIAAAAASAWSREAVLAERREHKGRIAEGLPEAASLSEEMEDRLFSENPDRGQAA